jgi:hypothetical protein
MKKYVIAICSMIILGSLGEQSAYSAVTPKAGQSCKTNFELKKIKKQSFICAQQGKKLVWKLVEAGKNKSSSSQPSLPQKPIVTINSNSSEDKPPRSYEQTFNGPCDYEIDIEKYWEELQSLFRRNNWCLGPTKIREIPLTSEIPRTSESSSTALLPNSDCKIREIQQFGTGRAFPEQRGGRVETRVLHPGPQTVIQIIPIYAPDAPKTGGSPRDDYRGYINFMESYISYASDKPSKFEIRVPEEYIFFPKKLGDFDMNHGNNWDHPIHLELGKEILEVVDPKINFQGVDLSIVVAPAGTSHEVFEQAVLNRSQNYSILLDGNQMEFMSIGTPATFNSYPKKDQLFSAPMWWFHELHHVGMGLADHNGDSISQHSLGPITESQSHGMGNWGLMSLSKTELTTWEKWFIGYIHDSQVRCVNNVNSTTHWLTPSSHKSQKTKLLVIRLSDSKAILVESIRAGGLNYKLSSTSEGALVYLLDTREVGREYGLSVLRASTTPLNTEPFFLSNATLKLGEKIVYAETEIEVVEAGKFGDVIKVTPKSNN